MRQTLHQACARSPAPGMRQQLSPTSSRVSRSPGPVREPPGPLVADQCLCGGVPPSAKPHILHAVIPAPPRRGPTSHRGWEVLCTDRWTMRTILTLIERFDQVGVCQGHARRTVPARGIPWIDRDPGLTHVTGSNLGLHCWVRITIAPYHAATCSPSATPAMPATR